MASFVARSLECDFVDLDDLVEHEAGISIDQIFRDGGEEAFRKLETQVLQATTAPPGQVVSLGGGAILREENRKWIKQHGTCVWLDADPATVAKRLLADASTASRRPALTDLDFESEIESLMSQRRPFYDEVADLRIDTATLGIEEVAKRIVAFASNRE